MSLAGKAVELAKYMKATRNGELLRVAVYITERCDSRCLICGMWKKKNPKDMPLEMFYEMLGSIGRGTHLAILGGEPLLHPDIEGFLKALRHRGSSYNLETNGIKADKLVDLVRKYEVPEVQISCDGIGKTYKKIRGIDNYRNVVWLITELPFITRVRVNYTICPWNSRGDLLEVKRLCNTFGAELSVEVYGEFEYLGTGKAKMDGIYRADDTQPFPRSLLLRLYGKWARGDLPLPCRAVRWSCAVVPDGTVYLCTHKMVALGNLNENTLDEIWQSDETKKLQSEYEKCNGCWSGCYRNLDVALGAVKNPRLLFRGNVNG